MKRFVIITPAYNEEHLISKTIRSVVNQTVKPLKWIIVNDGSTDQTDKIAEIYSQKYNFIELINIKRTDGHNFGNKVLAFNNGLERVSGLEYKYIGNLDADISMEYDYFEELIINFEHNSNLGIAGGMVNSLINGKYVSQNVALDSVAGAVQMFRRECFEQIGGYMALPKGGIDTAAEIMARMKGWEVKTFPGLRVFENRKTGSATASPLGSRFKEGLRLHSLGYGLLFFVLRCIYRSMEKPILSGSMAALFGYLTATVKGNPVCLPSNVVGYLKREQRGKILKILIGHIPIKHLSTDQFI